jgi:lipopolysaccharide biosynthesis glycosyltransferase
LPASVLAFSIHEKAQAPVSVEHLYRVDEAGIDDRLCQMQRTAFSLQRFLLARVMLRRGFDLAIYLDSDMLMLRSVDELVAHFDTSGSSVAVVDSRPEWHRQRQSSVIVMNCEGAERLHQSFMRFAAGEISYDELIYLKTIGPLGVLDSRWNGLEYLDQDMALIHYTDMDRQPWLAHGNPNSGIWYANLWRFTRSRAGMEVLAREAAARHVRPALLEIIKEGPSISARSNSALLADLCFIPPHRFKRIKAPAFRRLAAPLLRAAISSQSFMRNGQLNVR